VQELGFRVLAAYSESNKRGVAEAFVEDLLSAVIKDFISNLFILFFVLLQGLYHF